jgi:hypothetical protein
MKIGSLVRIRSAHDSVCVGKLAIVLCAMPYDKDVLRICFVNDGCHNSYHKSRLEVICEGR